MSGGESWVKHPRSVILDVMVGRYNWSQKEANYVTSAVIALNQEIFIMKQNIFSTYHYFVLAISVAATIGFFALANSLGG